MTRYYHGGIRGLNVGDMLVPSPPHVEDGCFVCTARAEGRVVTVGEWRASMVAQGRPDVARLFPGVPDDAPMDPPTAERAVYVTTIPLYALWYAARSGNGDLYLVEPVGEVTPTEEDHFASFTCESARVVSVLRRRVFLTPKERARIMLRWQRADRRAEMRRG